MKKQKENSFGNTKRTSQRGQFIFKAETRRWDKSPQQIALCDTVNFMKIIVAAVSRTNANQFEFVRLIAATKLARAALSHRVYTSGNKSLRQNINEPMRERHMVSHIDLEN